MPCTAQKKGAGRSGTGQAQVADRAVQSSGCGSNLYHPIGPISYVNTPVLSILYSLQWRSMFLYFPTSLCKCLPDSKLARFILCVGVRMVQNLFRQSSTSFKLAINFFHFCMFWQKATDTVFTRSEFRALLSSHSCWSRLDSDFVSSNPLSLFAICTTFSTGPAQFPFSFF